MWYFEENGQTVGPVQDAEIRTAIAANRLTRTTLVWRDGMGGWLPAEQTVLAPAFAAAFPPAFGQAAPRPGMWTGAPPPVAAPFGAPPFGNVGFSPSGYPAAQPVRFAGFWIRLGAYVIDAILVQIGIYALAAAVNALMAQVVILSDRSMELTNVELTSGIVAFLWVLLYYVVSQASTWQATPGKRFLGLRIIRTDAQRIGLGLSLGRYLSYIVSGVILGIGFLMIGWTDQKKALHDIMCGTRVVYGKA